MSRRLTPENNILRGLCRLAAAVVVTLLLLIPCFAQHITNQPFYNIAHMTNTREAVDWAIKQGANGVELDLQFDANGKPTEFKHGGSCDCSCLGTPPADHVCTPLLDSCDARSDPTQLLNHIAKTNLALVYIDSKVDIKTHSNAGNEVIQLLERDLFEAEFQGIVIVAAPDNYYYLNTAASRMASSIYQDRIFFTLDMDRDRTAQETIDVLQLLPTRNLVYSTGISACVPPLPYISTYYDDIETAVNAQGDGKLKMTGIWTIDSEGNMGNYINTGVGAIVTNKPGILKQVLIKKNLSLAAPIAPQFNLALGKPASQSSESWGGSPNLAVDGKTSGHWLDNSVTHTEEEDNPWWEVDLGADYWLDSVMIYNRTDCCSDRLNNFHLEVRTQAGAVIRNYDHPGGVEESTRIPLRSGGDLKGRYVKISLPGSRRILNLAEVQVFKWSYQNLALGKQASQSSVGWGGLASRAVDGNTNGNFANNSVTHTMAEYFPWWQVDLGSNQLVEKIIIYNRTDCCSDRLNNFNLQTRIEVGGLIVPNYTYQHNGAAGSRIEIPVNQSVRYVTITVASVLSPRYLSLAEVEVLARR